MKKKTIKKLFIFDSVLALCIYGTYKLIKKNNKKEIIKRNYTKLGTIYLDENKEEQFLPIKQINDEGRSYTKIKRND